jgi:hypothetical protein
MIIIGVVDSKEYLEDGQQRNENYIKFITNNYFYSTAYMSPTEKDKRSFLNGKYFEDLDENTQQRILDAEVAVMTVEFDTEREAAEAFHAFNASGKRLNKAENIYAKFTKGTRSWIKSLTGQNVFSLMRLSSKRHGDFEFVVDMLATIDTQLEDPGATFDAKYIADWTHYNNFIPRIKRRRLGTALDKAVRDIQNIVKDIKTSPFARKSNMHTMLDTIVSFHIEGKELCSDLNLVRNDLDHFMTCVREESRYNNTNDARYWAMTKNDGLGNASKRLSRRKILRRVLSSYYA